MSAPTTIFALSSAPGRAAIAVIRISGPAAGTALHQLAGRTPPPRQAILATLSHPKTRQALDQALVLYFVGPASETGEDIVELQVHGGRAVVRAVLDALSIIPGCRPAEPGEFAHRAFVNGKLDLTAAEGLADLIDAETEAQRQQAISLAAGHLATLYDGWRNRLIECQALVESAIDFSDEGDVSDGAIQAATQRATALRTTIQAHLDGAERGEIIRDGFRVVIAGPPNAGKSTLLNALARRDAAIVSEEAGTTRDAIEVHLDLAGLPVVVTDTAGIRAAGGAIEREGIRRTYERARSANLIIWLTDMAEPLSPPPELATEGTPVLTVANKADRLPAGPTPPTDTDLRISAKTMDGLNALSERLISEAQHRIGDGQDLVPTSVRQAFHLRSAVEHLDKYLNSPAEDIELRAEDLRLAGDSLGRLTGRIDAEDVLDQIFSRFCIGK
ncbi:MAG: tRNA uridine-5-carboxymethylaminomethyl(34) synthesis GTPase MnmE [Hyphomicrobiaceae bacterium]